jgi:ATP-dependent RNA helicase SUPV3L1/SUV3
MLERLADLIRPMDVRGGFEATPDMLSITGCTLEQIAELLKSLGFDGKRGERPKPARMTPEVKTWAVPVSTEASTDAGEPAPAEQVSGEAPVDDPLVDTAAADGAAAPETEMIPDAKEEETANQDLAPAPAPASGLPTGQSPEETGAKVPLSPEPNAEAIAEAKAEDRVTAGESGEAEIEVFYIFKLRGRQRPVSGDRRHHGGGGDPIGKKQGGKNNLKGKGGKGQNRPAHHKAASKPDKPRRPEKVADPLSPFAILQQLKDK